MSKKLHATQIQSLRKLEPPEMAVFRHSRYRYFWEKCYGNPDPEHTRELTEQLRAAGVPV
ncbi:hypothetical protein [Pseudomonas proteolytica]|uniref:hypothetical protein n=1 Tax=Pseudomonas proteolytica TaxID=219574 RepID=UPI0030D9A073